MNTDPLSTGTDSLAFSVSREAGYAVLSVAGNIDTGTEQRFRDALTSVHGEVAQVLSITGVAEVIPVADSVADAVAALGS